MNARNLYEDLCFEKLAYFNFIIVNNSLPLFHINISHHSDNLFQIAIYIKDFEIQQIIHFLFMVLGTEPLLSTQFHF